MILIHISMLHSKVLVTLILTTDFLVIWISLFCKKKIKRSIYGKVVTSGQRRLLNLWCASGAWSSLCHPRWWWWMRRKTRNVCRFLHASLTDLYLGQVEDFREDADVVGVWDEGVKSLTAGHGGGHALQLVTAHVQLLQQLQLAQLTDNVNGAREKQTRGQDRMQKSKPQRQITCKKKKNFVKR